ncbi:hypothetical protein NUSPORA_00915 [Nucleospora cyclopteri]
MHNNLNNNKIAYEIIHETCKALLEENTIHNLETNAIHSLRNDWIKTYENFFALETLNAKEVSDEEDLNAEMSDIDSEDSEIIRAENGLTSYIVCLFTKVTKSKGKWKCSFKDGFSNSDGSTDVPFNSASGELEW